MHHQTYPAMFIEEENLHGVGSRKDTRNIIFDIRDHKEKLSFKAGDALAVTPKNDPDLIKKILVFYNWGKDDKLSNGMIAYDFLSSYDITNLTKDIFKLLNNFFPELEQISKDTTKRNDFLWGKDLIDLKIKHEAFTPSLDELADVLKPLRPRLYSIASSPNEFPNEIHLTIAVARWKAHGRDRVGVCSNYLANLLSPSDMVEVCVHESKKFSLPEDSDRPLIMVGPGTGIAPFRAFLQERNIQNAKGETWLFFGNPHAATDFLYADEHDDMMNDGLITRLDTAFSRDQEHAIYVQHRMLENSSEIYKWIIEKGAYFYVCGDAKRMAKDVHQALVKILIENGDYDEDSAEAYLKNMKKENKYQRDVYSF